MNLPATPWPPTVAVDDSHLITEDNAPVDSVYSEQQMRLLVESLTASWKPKRKFVACANVGLFLVNRNPAIVPDVMLSMDVEHNPDRTIAAGKSYLVWEKGKVPDLVVEIVSNRIGEELTRKRRIYGRDFKIPYYIVWDPEKFLKGEPLTVFELVAGKYRTTPERWFPDLGLGLTTWKGVYEGVEDEWLRWVDAKGNAIPFGKERADAATKRAKAEAKRAATEARHAMAAAKRAVAHKREAEAQKREAEAARRETETLKVRLRELGVDPDRPPK